MISVERVSLGRARAQKVKQAKGLQQPLGVVICLCLYVYIFTTHCLDRADSLAKNVTESDLYIEWIAVEDICSYYSNFSIQKPTENFRNSKYLEILGDLPSILSLAPWLKNRREDIIITRSLTRMIITPALLHRFGLHKNPFCAVCNQGNTIEHILFICKKYLPRRRI
ncbi:hypothetical protein AVEN_222894-1 [Araneus ventricosus]|uniref:Reverse transcriptase zinc-binding domain-containing protein n=1 Tax=Araneus ventricosus TaxID=182803 RepID=A0A4Y2FHC7_ARAVE|nr:hypothetical protein AVEN_160500-1 [Araneus ventricosus]GBM40980.1 hypothetical protein AVEN_222894-1 [Araneus ventricosus]